MNDPALIAIEALTRHAKVKKWGFAIVKIRLLKAVHLALAKHNIERKHHRHEFDSFRLITGLHDRSCLIQREGETFWFFADGVKGVVIFNDWRPIYKQHRHCVFLTTLDDDSPYFEWPVYVNSIPLIDVMWAMVTTLRTGEKVECGPLFVFDLPILWPKRRNEARHV